MKTLLALGMATLAPVVLAGDGDYYLSSPATGTIWRGNQHGGGGEAFVTGVKIPHYGHFLPDGTLYMPDRGWPALLKISPEGVTTALSAGGLFEKPVTCIPSLDGQALVVSDGGADMILRVDLATGQQTVMFDNVSAGGLFDSPDGLAYDDAGNLYVANLEGHTVVRVEPDGTTTVFADSTLVSQPGGLAIDGAGNLFVANYGSSNIVRFRLDTGEGEVFAFDVSKMAHPNDIKLSRSGGIITTTRQSNVCRIDALGNIVVEFNDPNLGEIVGVSAPEDAIPCSGRFLMEESGSVGSGGFVPKMRAIFSPCPGQVHAFEFVDFLGGAPAVLFLGFGPGHTKVAGANFYLNPSLPLITVPFVMPGSGPGNGDLRLQFQVPDDANLIGANLYFQVLAGDPALPTGVAWTNRLHEIIGN